MSNHRVAILGNPNENYEPHCRMDSCFKEFQTNFDFTFEWIPTETLSENPDSILSGFQGIVAGSGPYLSKEGVINGIRYARTNNIPFLGTCSGFGYAVLEFGQFLLNLGTVHHPYEDVELTTGETFLQQLNNCCAGMHTIRFEPVRGSLTAKVYKNSPVVQEESHCTYGISTHMVPVFAKAGLLISGYDDEKEAKIMEYKKSDFFIITLFLPQFRSDIENPHPLLSSFFRSVMAK
ncbi:MAG: hypothetical protein JO080_00355 [Mucilaginibacter sp.]|nr:hypothetical protein [Mucilaginibacter sp.]